MIFFGNRSPLLLSFSVLSTLWWLPGVRRLWEEAAKSRGGGKQAAWTSLVVGRFGRGQGLSWVGTAVRWSRADLAVSRNSCG